MLSLSQNLFNGVKTNAAPATMQVVDRNAGYSVLKKWWFDGRTGNATHATYFVRDDENDGEIMQEFTLLSAARKAIGITGSGRLTRQQLRDLLRQIAARRKTKTELAQKMAMLSEQADNLINQH